MPVTEFENNLATFLGVTCIDQSMWHVWAALLMLQVMDNHLAAEERRVNPGVSSRGVSTLIKRRWSSSGKPGAVHVPEHWH
jgi:hypothetical protein